MTARAHWAAIGCALLGATFGVQPEAGPPGEDGALSGHYRHVHTVRHADEDSVLESEAVDDLWLHAAEEGAMRFSLETVAHHGSTCKMEGLAKRVEDRFVFQEPIDLDPSVTGGKTLVCVLELRLVDDGIVLRDVGRHCRLYFCGMRASLDGLRFERVER